MAAAPTFSWTGFYIGGVIGNGTNTSDHMNASVTPPWPQVDSKGRNRGVTAGFNRQIGQLVFGVEGDWSWADMHGSTNSTPGAPFGCAGSCDTKINSFETLRGRV